MRLRFSTIALLVTLVCSLADALTPSKPIPPPEDWEDKVLPGFTPSIESVIVAKHLHQETLDWSEYTRIWGPKCVEGLIALYRNPEWAKFSNAIMAAMAHADYPEMRAWFENSHGA